MKTFGLFASFVFGVLLLVPDARAQESPLQVEGATTVDAAAAKALFDRAVPFVDVRSKDLWEAGHIPGAVLIWPRWRKPSTARSRRRTAS